MSTSIGPDPAENPGAMSDGDAGERGSPGAPANPPPQLDESAPGSAQRAEPPASTDDVLARLAQVVAERRSADPDKSYVARLLTRGNDAILKKVGEEATEVVMAGKDGVADRIVAETADLWFHCLVMLEFHGIGPAQVLAELARREGLSGLDEKAQRRAAEREMTGE